MKCFRSYGTQKKTICHDFGLKSPQEREYGDGLDKFRPNDISEAKVVNLDIVEKETKNRILEYYRLYRQKEIGNGNTVEVKNRLNEIFYGLLKMMF